MKKIHKKTKAKKYLQQAKLKRKRYSNLKSSRRFQHAKLPGIITAIFILSMIIILPTLIVMIPNKSEHHIEGQAVTVSTEEKEDDVKPASLEVEVSRTDDDVEKVPLEEYVTSVVAAEMPAEFEEEALKAQAIAARTYVVNHLRHHDEDGDTTISDETDDQVYLNKQELKQKWGKEYHWKLEKVADAVNATEQKIITYDQEPITPTFFSMSNGYTEDAENYWGDELPYLKSVESKWEESNPKFTEQKIFDRGEMTDKTGISLAQTAEVPIEISRTPSERVDKIRINNEEFSGRELREKLDLRSNDFTVKQKDNHFIFTTKGYGHGVGMSQYGANGMAEEGNDYEDIIQHYYQGVELQSINDAVPTLVAK